MAPMWLLPSALRARIAMVTILGIFLVPVTTSSLRGLNHVLSCRDEVQATLAVDTTAAGNSVVLGSADTVTREEPPALCGGLTVSLTLAEITEDRADVVVSIANDTDADWTGSVELRLGNTSVPVGIGSVDVGTTATDTVRLRVEPDRRYEISGTLLIGP